MNDCKTTEKTSGLGGLNLTSINNILNIISGLFSSARKPATPIPPFLLLVGSKTMPGMSPRNLAANMMSKLESEAGIPINDLATYGERNPVAALSLISSQEIVGHIQNNAKVSTIIDPGSINVTVVGSNAAGPLIASGGNTIPTVTGGIVQ